MKRKAFKGLVIYMGATPYNSNRRSHSHTLIFSLYYYMHFLNPFLENLDYLLEREREEKK